VQCHYPMGSDKDWDPDMKLGAQETKWETIMVRPYIWRGRDGPMTTLKMWLGNAVNVVGARVKRRWIGGNGGGRRGGREADEGRREADKGELEQTGADRGRREADGGELGRMRGGIGENGGKRGLTGRGLGENGAILHYQILDLVS
jgi:hypothetical protein